MKRVAHFLLAVIILVIIAYTQPILSPKEKSEKNKPIETTISSTNDQTFLQGKITSTGLSSFIGKSPNTFVKEYGEYLEVQELDEKSAWWIFGDSSEDYVQVLVMNDIIQSIFVLGKAVPCDAFEIGMTLNEITGITTLYSNFRFDYQEEHYVVELSEKDMNYQPLVAFDNGSFAILHLNKEDGTLLGVRYVNPVVLLSLMPYQLQEGSLLTKEENMFKSDNYQDSQERQFFSIVDIIREHLGQEHFEINETLMELAGRTLADFTTNQSKYLNEERLEELETEISLQTYEDPFYLTQDEFQPLKTSYLKDFKNSDGLIYAPTQDIPYMIMNWYGDLLHILPMDHLTPQEIGIAFEGDFVLVLLNELESQDLEESTLEKVNLE